MPSLASKAMPAVIWLLGYKKHYRSAAAVFADVAEQQSRPASHVPPKRLGRTVDVSVRQVNGWPVYEVNPRGAPPLRRALYVHGGAWICEITHWHWGLVAKLAAATATRFLVPIYPLTPAGTAASVVPAVTDLAAGLLAEVGPERTTILGDSAGGTIALAVALQLRARGLGAPQTVLISPALDLTFSDPAMDEIAPRDPWLARPGLQAAADLWRGDLSLDDVRVSPIHGDLSGLARITLFTGTRDLLNVDARRLVRLAKAAGAPLDFHEVPEMLHVYPLLPIPEAKQARSIMESVLTH